MIEKAQEWIANGNEVALATVIATWGSSSRQAGSQLVVDTSGRFEGSVSGGCVEGAVVEEALAVIREGKPKRMFFGVTRDQALGSGAGLRRRDRDFHRKGHLGCGPGPPGRALRRKPARVPDQPILPAARSGWCPWMNPVPSRPFLRICGPTSNDSSGAGATRWSKPAGAPSFCTDSIRRPN